MIKAPLKSAFLSIVFVFLFSLAGLAQSNSFEVKVTTKKGESYHLVDVRGYGGFDFQCKKNKAEFRLNFDKVKTIDFEKKKKKHFRKAQVLLTNGEMDEIWFKDGFKEDGYKTKFTDLSIEGKSKDYGSQVRLKIKEIDKISFIR